MNDLNHLKNVTPHHLRRIITICVNGIMNWPGTHTNWNGKMVTWTHENTESRCEKVEYFTTPFLLKMYLRKNRMYKLASMIRRYSANGWEIILVGHSNGCAVILDALDYLDWPRVAEIHFFSGACEADFDKNGLRWAQENNVVGHVYCYGGGKDSALWFADSWIGRVAGYGTIGRTGPRNFIEAKTTVKNWKEFGHSDCWNDINFDATARLIHGARVTGCGHTNGHHLTSAD